MKEHQESFCFDLPSIDEDEMGIGLINVPPDNESPFRLSVYFSKIAYGDIFIGLVNTGTGTDNAVFLPPIRLRSSIGGGFNPFISEELGSLIHLFRDHNGYTPVDFDREEDNDRINPNSVLQVTMEKDDNGFKIENIQDDDEQHNELSKFLDIEITDKGDVILTQRHIRQKYEGGDKWSPVEDEGKMVFKSGANGGQYPLVAAIFTRIAERIANATTLA